MSSERLAALLDEYAELEKRLADPAIHADQATARRVGRRYAELVAAAQGRRRAGAGPCRPGRGPGAGRRGPGVRGRGRGDRGGPAGAGGAARRAADPARPARRQGRDRRDQGRRGRRGVGAVRRRPAADVHPVRRAARLGHRGDRRAGLRPRRGQGRLAGDQDQGRAGGRQRRLVAAEVGGRRAPGAAGPGHRVAGPHPHQRRRRAGAARGRGRRRHHRRRTTCGSTCSARPGRAASR